MPVALERLRSKVSEFVERHMYDSAVFLADKLVTMSGGQEEDVYTLAQAYYQAGLHQRAIHVVKKAELLKSSPGPQDKFRFLVAKCHIVKEEWDEALAVLQTNEEAQDEPEPAPAADFRSSMSLLRGTIYDAMDDRENAALAYRRALQLDCFCYEAFQRLTQHHLLGAEEEQSLIAGIEFGGEEAWLELLYRAKVTRYENASRVLPPLSPDLGDGSMHMATEHEDERATPPSLTLHLDELESEHNLAGNLDLKAHRAEIQYYNYEHRAAVVTCRDILERDPHNLTCLPVYLCTLHELQQKNELFYQAHKLVDNHPQSAVAWFAVGCYYHLTGNYDSARRYFEKATHLDNWFAPAWLGYGNAFAAQDESDQAMVAYRTAAKLFPGCHFCPLFVGMECARTNNLPLAVRYFDNAKEICPSDPLVYHEVGVVHYKNQELPQARDCFLHVLKLCEGRRKPSESTLFNLGHTCRKLRLFDDAIKYYNQALHAEPHKASTHAALGFTYHLTGNLHRAIEYYHQALGLKSEDTFATAMLSNAFDEMAIEPSF